MRYNDCIQLIYFNGPEDDLTGEVSKRKVTLPATIVPVTDANKLATYGLLKTVVFEVHLKNQVDIPDRVVYENVERRVITAIRGRKVRVLTFG
ncbi:hypothetical protein [Lactiplantibacillus plantarum]|uniref:hypothetical protein n=1 Tax=Lactiplantibacillus plantarum TaxID=1590 RepID=UPI00157F6910|nr:hypothetical protein [Lactiplantibacillus plantarum]QRG93731.1 hypothetical protein JNO58_10415 [Lactiplantibacillus plantarum]QRG93772.1 hypothetical protein JNO58_10680 [Lactiplantibacillus plantarum]BEI64673.1 hypothetical protein IYO1511_c21580 [Lactiplantibacillus plantarum]